MIRRSESKWLFLVDAWRFGLAGLAVGLLLGSPLEAADKPNIVIFLADDLGVGSTEPYGADRELVRTPALAQLAANGLTFDRAYSTGSVCSPTRYGLLTGRYSWRTRMKKGVVNTNAPLLIETDRPTIGSWLQGQGYETGQFGKWHLGYKAENFENLLGDISPGPNDVGFDYHFGVPNNMDDVHKVYVENNRVFGLRSNRMSPYGRSFYGKTYAGYDAPQRVEPEVMQTLTDKAVGWLDTRKKPDKPFFMYFAAVAVHHPIMPSPRMLGTSPAGAYGDFIHDLDASVGQLLDALARRGELENTLFLFVSDNGGDIPKSNERPERQAFELGLAINGELRGDKHTIFEGGLRSPMIASWPGKIAPGGRTDAFVTTADFFATLVEVISGSTVAETELAPDSYSFAEVLRNPAASSPRPHGVFREAPGRKALRRGDWKYIDDRFPGDPDRKSPVQLYNLAEDPSETKNLAKAKPELVAEMRALLDAIIAAPSSRLVGAE